MNKIVDLAKSSVGKVSLLVLALGTMGGRAFAQITTGSGVINPIPIYESGFATLISDIIDIILLIAGVLAIGYLIWGGIMYITAGGDAEKASKGRVAITNAIIGILIIAASFAIYNFIISPSVLG